MITIYIVDDEPMAIQYLQYLLSRSGAACRVAGSSTNSRHALKEILSTKPDVVFTDISMPVMDGLELARRVLEQQAARVYLLTSYADFEYAKQGVKIGVRDYILKNELSEALLKSLLERAEAELDEERRAQRLVLERGVRDFLLDEAAPAPELPPLPDAEGGYALMLLFAPVSIPMARREAAEPAPPDAGALLAAVEAEGLRGVTLARMLRGESCAVVSGDAHALIRLDAAAQRMLDGLPGWKCALSDAFREPAQLRAAYRAAGAWRDYLFADPDRSLFHAGDFAPRRKVGAEEIDETMERIQRLLRAGERAQALMLIAEFLNFARQNLNLWEYAESARQLYRAIRRATLRATLQAVPAAADAYDSADALESFLLRCADAYFDALEARSAHSYSDCVQRALDYIRRNYHRNILVTDISAASGVSEGHLRRLFKQELDTSVIDYLTDYRIEQVKLRMEEGGHGLDEIWRGCGFSSAQYFNQVFRRREGALPREYLRRLREGEA